MATLIWVPSSILAFELHAREGEVVYTVTRHTAFGFTQNKYVAYAVETKLGAFDSNESGLSAAKLSCQAHADSH